MLITKLNSYSAA